MTAPDTGRRYLEAQAAHDAANQAWDRALGVVRERQAELDRLVAALESPEGSDITPGDLADARAALEHAQHLVRGAERPLADLGRALNLARAEDACDLVGETLAPAAGAFRDALTKVEAALSAFVDAARTYDAVEAEVEHRILPFSQSETPRIVHRQHRPMVVDGVALVRSRADGHLARAVCGAMKGLGAPAYAIDGLKLLADTASPLPVGEVQ